MRKLMSTSMPDAMRQTVRLVALFVVFTGAPARAQFPAPPTTGGTGVTAQVTKGGPFAIFAGTDQGQQFVTDQQTVSQFAQYFAGASFVFQEQTRSNGLGVGTLTISKGGQPVFAQPASYFDPNSDQSNVFFHYSNKKTILNGRLYRNPQDHTQGAAELFLTVIGNDGTPLSGFLSLTLAFSP